VGDAVSCFADTVHRFSVNPCHPNSPKPGEAQYFAFPTLHIVAAQACLVSSHSHSACRSGGYDLTSGPQAQTAIRGAIFDLMPAKRKAQDAAAAADCAEKRAKASQKEKNGKLDLSLGGVVTLCRLNAALIPRQGSPKT